MNSKRISMIIISIMGFLGLGMIVYISLFSLLIPYMIYLVLLLVSLTTTLISFLILGISANYMVQQTRVRRIKTISMNNNGFRIREKSYHNKIRITAKHLTTISIIISITAMVITIISITVTLINFSL